MSSRCCFQLNDGEQLYASSLPGNSRADRVGERSSLIQVGRRRLAPQHVRERRVRQAARDRGVQSRLHAVEALARPRAGREARVALVDVRREQRGRERVGARDDERRDAEHVGRQARRGQRPDELLGRDQDLAAQMPALLLAGELVLEVHARRACLDHRSHQLERVQRAAEPGLGVGHDRRDQADVGAFGPRDLVRAHQRVVQPSDHGRDRVRRVERLVRVRLAGQVRVGGDLPAREVDRLESGLQHLDGLSTRHGAERRDVVPLPQQLPQSLRAEPRDRVLHADRATEPDDILTRVRPLDPAPARVGRPLVFQLLRFAADPGLRRRVDHRVPPRCVGGHGSGNEKTLRRGEGSGARPGSCEPRAAP